MKLFNLYITNEIDVQGGIGQFVMITSPFWIFRRMEKYFESSRNFLHLGSVKFVKVTLSA